jgi:hypothetical protein
LCLYFIWESCGPPLARPFGRAALCGLFFAFLAPNWAYGRADGWTHRQQQEAFLADVRAGVPIPQLVARHSSVTFYVHDVLEEILRLLRDRRYADYASIPADPSFREVRLMAPPTSASDLIWDGERGRSTSDTPEMIFDLPRPIRIAGIRLRYSNVNPGGWTPLFEVGWRTCGDEEQGKQWKSHDQWRLASGGQLFTIPLWIDDTVDRIRIRPDKRPCDFTLSDIVLLVLDPPTDPKAKGERSHQRATDDKDETVKTLDHHAS